MIIGLVVLVIMGIIYYSTYKIPPEPIFKQEQYVEENDFWDDMSEEDFKDDYYKEVNRSLIPFVEEPSVKVKKTNRQKERQQSKAVKRRRKRRKIAKKSRQQNRS